MSRKSLLVALGFVVVLIIGTVVLIGVLFFHEPEFYRRVAVQPGEQRKQRSRQFVMALSDLTNDITNERLWGARFPEDQINSYFAENFEGGTSLQRAVLPEGLSCPRLAIDQDRLRLGFRYGEGRWSTIVSVDLKIWLAKGRANVLGVEIQDMRIGSLPIKVQSILERVSEVARRLDIELTWYRAGTRPVALLAFAPGRKDPSVQLMTLRLQPSALSLTGKDRTSEVGAQPVSRIIEKE